MNFRGIFYIVGAILIGLVIGVPILSAIFAGDASAGTGGPFAQLTFLVTDTNNAVGAQYRGILQAIVALIPLLVVGFFAFRFFKSRMGR